MKGIIMAGGFGSRLYPLTHSISKQLLPVYDKPMIYYPLSVLMQANIQEILIICMPRDRASFTALLGDGQRLGLKIQYQDQPYPGGLAQAFILGEHFIAEDNVCFILGDNIFYGAHFEKILSAAAQHTSGARIFASKTKTPELFGVIEQDAQGSIISIQEKPQKPLSGYAVTGLYFYDNDVIAMAKDLKPSERNELEITDINNSYLARNELQIEYLTNDVTWFDSGTIDSLIDAANFIKNKQNNNLKIGCPELIAHQKQWISSALLLSDLTRVAQTPYVAQLKEIIKTIL
ncbi:UNVERIFIED_CONTAM: hypothetical protein GTU68_035407 [Idotea baltica]|nr:hypothetical protein [Idotea baltica]